MPYRIGKYTLAMEKPPIVLSCASVGSKKEGEGNRIPILARTRGKRQKAVFKGKQSTTLWKKGNLTPRILIIYLQGTY